MPAVRWKEETRRKAMEGWHHKGSPWVRDLGSKDPLEVK